MNDRDTYSPPPEAAPFDHSQVGEAAAYLKTLAHQGRLLILCHLCEQERSVSELESLLDIRQAAVSQMLARLREENLVTTRREGKTVYYALQGDRTQQVIGLLHSLFCETEDTP